MSNSRAREERIPGFHENAELQFELGIRCPFAISASRRAARKCKKTHYFRLRSVCSRKESYRPHYRNRKTLHFWTLKSVSFCTFRRRGGRRKSQTGFVFPARIAIPRFRGNPESVPRVRADSTSRYITGIDRPESLISLRKTNDLATSASSRARGIDRPESLMLEGQILKSRSAVPHE